MKPYRQTRLLPALVVAALLAVAGASPSQAAVRAQLSSQEAYVGMPLTLYLQVSGADADAAPQVPQIDGVEIEAAGAPSRSSQVTIVNGQRSENTSVTYAYRVTPRRAGTFVIPALEVKTAGGVERTRAIRFSATTSETGDLLFAEVAGQQERLFVGQPIDLTLKIWLKPYVDREREVKLSADHMWQLISTEQTRWGGFADALKDLAAENQTVRGREVLRADKDGVQRSYYLYEIDATIYPKSAGQLDVDDVQIVAQYPTKLDPSKLGQSRDPFESFFKNSGFMDDDFFGSRFSPFSRSLTVTASRPIVIEPEVASITVDPIPTVGQPADYRGAVGQYAIATEATPTSVKAGDPITLRLGIQGSGPMSLVQAPPLAELSELTGDFKVNDEPLAGIVQGDIKVFSTTIRPRRQGVSEIPAIPFSFFDLSTQTFVTVRSEPIAVTVSQADMLALTSIVGDAGQHPSANQAIRGDRSGPMLDNYEGASVLSAQTGVPFQRAIRWTMVLAGGLVVLIFVGRAIPSLGLTPSRYLAALSEIGAADNANTVAQAIRRYVDDQFGKDSTPIMRANEHGLHDLLDQCDNAAFAGGSSQSVDELKQQAGKIAAKLSQRQPKKRALTISPIERPVRVLASVVACGVLAALVGLAVTCPQSPTDQLSASISPVVFQLTSSQQQTLLEEATDAYHRGLAAKETDAADAQQAFSTAAQKYQTLVDSGVDNSQIHFNLGNAYLQSDRVGLAIANYKRSSAMSPLNFKARRNLKLASEAVQRGPVPDRTWSEDLGKLFGAIPQSLLIGLLGLSWLMFCGMAILRMMIPSKQRRGVMLASVGVVVLISGALLYSSNQQNAGPEAVVIVVDATTYAGGGETFEELPNAELNEGAIVRVVQDRGDWLQIESSTGSRAWIRSTELQVV